MLPHFSQPPSVNTLPGITSHFTTQNDKIAAKMEYFVAAFLHTIFRVFSDFVRKYQRNSKTAMQSLNTRFFTVHPTAFCTPPLCHHPPLEKCKPNNGNLNGKILSLVVGN